MIIAGYETHPAADLFPMLTDEELRDLARDIKKNGLREPVVVLGSKILDGRNRARACEMAEVELHTLPYHGDAGQAALLDFVVSKNLARRHLSPSQRAWLGAVLLEKYEEAGREAMREAGRRYGRGRPRKSDGPKKRAPQSRDRAAGAVGVSPRSIQDAKVVRLHADPTVQAAVADGALAVSAAKDLARLPPDRQREIVNDVRAGRVRNVATAVKNEERRRLRSTRARAPRPGPAAISSRARADDIVELVRSGRLDDAARTLVAMVGTQAAVDWLPFIEAAAGRRA